MLKISNSLTGEKEEFKPLEAGKVRMYVCGMTVYDHIHVGHARMLTVFDMVQRHLRSKGYEVTYVRNITDIDDKIITRAAERGEDWRALARRFTESMHDDCALLGLQPPDLEPRATDFIDAIIAMTSHSHRQAVRLRRRQRRCDVFGAQVPGVWPLSGKKHRRSARGRPRAGR